MKIVHVLDSYDRGNNGIATSTRRNVEALEALGHEVKVISTGETTENKVGVDEFTLPFFQKLVDAQGFVFAKADDSKFYDTFKGADIIHFHLSTPFCAAGEKIARQMNIPTIASFHVQPQNITYSVGLGTNQWVNDHLYEYFNNHFYKKFNYIHAPSQMIAEQLKNHGYKQDIRVISNGVNDIFENLNLEKPEELKDKFTILTVGRLSREKRQDLLIEAVKQSKYEKNIQLIFAGQGPEKEYLEDLADSLTNKPSFDFYSQEDLLKLMNQVDLYVHAADAEIEGISCLEAVACGLVPVISDSKLSATSSFAKTEHSIFKAGSSTSLAHRIDYWIEHPQKLEKYSDIYAKSVDSMRVSDCCQKMLALYEDAINKHKRDGYPKGDEKVEDDDEPGFFEKAKDKLNIFDFSKNISTEGTAGIAKAEAKGENNAKAKANAQTAKGPKVFKSQKSKTKKRDKVDKNKKSGDIFFYRIMRKIILFGVYYFLYIFYGIKIYGRENLKEVKDSGAISIMNHVHTLDSPMVRIAMLPNNVRFTSSPVNFKNPFIRMFLKIFRVIPTPTDYRSSRKFTETIDQELQKGNLVHIFPEGILIKGYDGLREFQDGAFSFAVKNNKPIVPMALKSVNPQKAKSRILTGRARFVLFIGEPLYPNTELPRKKAIKDLKQRAYANVNYLLNQELDVPDRFVVYDLARVATFTTVAAELIRFFK